MRAVVVTGASSGLGLASAAALANAGFIVYAGVRTEPDAQRLRSVHADVRPIYLDVTDDAAIDAAVREVQACGLPLAGLVNNAGIASGGPLETIPIAELRRAFDVNCFGAVAVTQAFLPLLRVQRSRILFIGSVSDRVAFPYISPYSASKFALRAFADALRIELRPSGIDVCLIEPGSVATSIWGKARAMREQMLQRVRADMPRYYRDAIGAVVRGVEGEERRGMPVERVAAVVVRTLTEPKPKAHRIVGAGAAIGAVLALLPSRWHDWFLRTSMRLP